MTAAFTEKYGSSLSLGKENLVEYEVRKTVGCLSQISAITFQVLKDSLMKEELPICLSPTD